MATRANGDTATGCSYNTERLPSAAFPPSTSSSGANGWGGARNRRDRTSERITFDQARNQMAAAAYAARIGLPLNRHCSVHWERQGLTDAEAGAATRSFLKSAGEFLRTRGQPFAWTFQRENGPAEGSHVHILMHVPMVIRAAFVARQRRWVRLATGEHYRRRALRSTSICGAGMPASEVYAANLAYILGYVLKGVSAADARALGLRRRPNDYGATPDVWGESGTISGKRVGRSANLDKAARRGWKLAFSRSEE